MTERTFPEIPSLASLCRNPFGRPSKDFELSRAIILVIFSINMGFTDCMRNYSWGISNESSRDEIILFVAKEFVLLR